MQRSLHTSRRQTVRTVCLFCAAVVIGLGLTAPSAQAQQKGNRLRPRYLSNEVDPARGREIMQTFRSMGFARDYYLEFNLVVLPRRGERRVVPGRMWGSRLQVDGSEFRAELADAESGLAVERLLSHSGADPRAWRYTPPTEIGADPSPVEELDAQTLLDPLAGTGLSMFELQMPFIHWEDFVYEGVTQVRGRAVQAFLMYPPEDFAAAHPEIAGVRIHLDAQFNALMQAVVLDADEQPERKLTVMDLKKLGDQWIVKSIDVRDEKTRDKVRFEVVGAALNLDFAPGLFLPSALSRSLEPPEDVEHF